MSSLKDNKGAVSCDGDDWRKLDIDGLWNYIGRFGKYQVTQMLWLAIIATSVSTPIFCGVFTGKFVEFKCVGMNNTGATPVALNESNKASTCQTDVLDNTTHVLETKQCVEYDYGSGSMTLSYVAEWDLVCDRETIGQLPQIMTMIGMGVGASLLTPIGDTFGRKTLVIGTTIGTCLVMLALAFVEHFWLFLILKLLAGVFQQAKLVPRYAMFLELFPIELRSLITITETVLWVMSLCLVGAIGYILRDVEWKTLQLAFAISTATGLISLWFVDESIRWYLDNSMVKEIERIVRKACKMNDKDLNKVRETCFIRAKDEMKLLAQEDTEDKSESSAAETLNIKTIIKNKRLRKIAIVMCYLWMNCSLTYYGLTLLSTSLAGDMYLNFVLSSLVEIPSCFVSYYCIQRYGRRRPIMAFNFICASVLAIAVLIANLAPSSNGFSILQNILTMIGKLFISSAFAAIWTYTHELYPTNLRGIGVGLSSTAARVGGTFSPLFTLLARKIPWAPGTIFATGCFVSVFLLMLLPETRWTELPRNVEDTERMFQNGKKRDLHVEHNTLHSNGDCDKII